MADWRTAGELVYELAENYKYRRHWSAGSVIILFKIYALNESLVGSFDYNLRTNLPFWGMFSSKPSHACYTIISTPLGS
jgi:hypothetical protein